MSKRFTCSEKWDDPWFRKLPVKYKVFWDFIYTKCDIIGVWKVDLEMAEFCINEKLGSEEEIFHIFNQGKERLKKIKNTWLITQFVEFQYGELIANNNLHKSVLRKLKELDISGAGEGLNIPTSNSKGNSKGNSKEELENVKISNFNDVKRDLEVGKNRKIMSEEDIKQKELEYEEEKKIYLSVEEVFNSLSPNEIKELKKQISIPKESRIWNPKILSEWIDHQMKKIIRRNLLSEKI